MVFKRNVPGWERGLRAAAGVGLLIAIVAVPLQGGTAWAAGAGGIILLATSLSGFCLACALVGRRLPGSP